MSHFIVKLETVADVCGCLLSRTEYPRLFQTNALMNTLNIDNHTIKWFNVSKTTHKSSNRKPINAFTSIYHVIITYILLVDLLIRDVNECDVSMNALLRDGCDFQADCTNTDGKPFYSQARNMYKNVK